jgi:excisionase family DNA binding protein
VRQVAELLGVRSATVYHLCEHGELAHVRVSHTIRVGSVDFAEFVNSRRKPRYKPRS